MGRPNPSRETIFSVANGDREILILPVQLTTSSIGNLTRLIYTLLYVMTMHGSTQNPRQALSSTGSRGEGAEVWGGNKAVLLLSVPLEVPLTTMAVHGYIYIYIYIYVHVCVGLMN